MSNSQNKSENDKFDIFGANDIYPDARGIFTLQLEALDAIKDTCLIVVDTNVLLLPYSTGRESLQRIGETYRQLVESEQLVIPGQVAREFAKNRATKLAELFQQIGRKGNVPNLQKGKYPLLESVKEYQELVELEQEIDKKLGDYRNTIRRLQEHIKGWAWNDPVSLLYSELFSKNAVFDPKFNKEEVLKDLDYRHTHKIPPGFKDASKDDRGIGDVLIWHTILQLGQKYKKSVLFVTGDEKTDWYHQSEKQGLYPRFELVDEFRRNSDGQSFHIISFSSLLNLYGASSDVVQEVRQRETQERIIQQQKFTASLTNEGFFVEQLVFEWLKQKFPNAEIDRFGFEGRDYGVDFLILDEENFICVEVKYFRRIVKSIKARLESTFVKLSAQKTSNSCDKLLLILVAQDFEDAVLMKQSITEPRTSSRFSEVNTIIGYITSEGTFNEIQ